MAPSARALPSLLRRAPAALWWSVLALLALLALGAARAAITHVGSSNRSGAGNTTSITINLPGGTAANDYLLAVIAQKGNGAISAPAGWTLLMTNDGTREPMTNIFGKVAGAGEPASYTFSSNRNDDITGGIAAFRGVDSASPIAASSIQANNNGDGGSIAPSISPAVANTLLVAVWTTRDALPTAPAGMTTSVAANSGSGNTVYATMAYETRAASGATGTRAASLSANKPSNGALLALRPALSLSVSGTVFEDANYGGGAGRSLSASAGSGTGSSQVELYDSAGNYLRSTSTAGDGSYSFTALSPGSYFVRVVSSSVRSNRSGSSASLVGVPTYRSNAGSGTALAVTDWVGGTDPALVDPGAASSGARLNTASYAFSAGLSGTAQAVAPVTLSTADVGGVDFGFNFSTIVNTNDSGQGSLRQFLANATALGGKASLAQAGNRRSAGVSTALAAGVEHSIFMIPGASAVPGLRAGLASPLLAGGWARITLASALPAIPASTVLDGATQTANVGDSNAGQVGSGGTVGVSAIALARFDRPEVELAGAQLSTVGGSGAALRAVALRQGRVALAAANTEVSDTLVAMGADGASDASTTTGAGYGISIGAQTGIVVRHNFVRVDNTAIGRDSAGGTATIESNEVQPPGSGQTSTMDGVMLSVGSNDLVRYNLIKGLRGAGYEVPWGGGSNLVFEENTISGNGLNGASASSEPGGIVIYGHNAAPSPQITIRRNVITGNGGPGISVARASRVLMTRNAIFGNGAGGVLNIGIDLDPLGRDGNSSNPPEGVTANTGSKNASLPNQGMNYPVFTSAKLGGSTLTLAGYVGSAANQAVFGGATVEVFVSESAAPAYGAGRSYLGSLVADANGNFSGTISVGAGVLAVGDSLTATATDSAGNTSEFGAGFATESALIVPAGFNAFETDTAAAAISGVIRAKVAGTAATLAVAALDASGTALHPGFTGSVALNWLDARNDSGALTGSCRASWTSLGAAGSASFSNNARVNVSLTPPPSGTRSMRLQMVYSGGPSPVTACSSDAFAALPATLTLAASDGDAGSAGSTRALTNTGASGGVVHRAGRPFTVSAVARDASGATMTGYDGTPALTVAGCLLPTGCSAGALTSSASAAVAGVYGNASVSYAEVGAISLQLIDSDYAAVDSADTSAAARTISSATLGVGRFVPDSLVVSVTTDGRLATANAGCLASGSGATFIGQGFGWATAPRVTVTAINAAGVTTTGWTGALMKLSAAAQTPGLSVTAAGAATLATSFGALTLTDLGGGQARLAASSLDRFVLDLPAGSVQSSVTPSWTWTLAVNDASEAGVAGNPSWTASASQPAVPFDQGAVFHTGRLTLSPSHGDARVGVRALLQLQRRTDAGWVTMTEDRGCVSVQPQHLGVESPSGVFSTSGDCAAPMTSSTTTAGGRAWLRLPATPGAAPGRLTLRLAGDAASGHSCSAAGASAALVSLGLPWLLGGPGGSGPAALATWGLPNRDLVLRRERW
jgi:hypothetical protein